MPFDNKQEEEIEEINEAVENGGGCTEAWEALSELRQENTTNRRNVLKSMGAVGSTAALISAGSIPTVAEERKSSSEEIKSALNSNQVQLILDELDDPQIKKGEATSRDMTVSEVTVTNTTLPTALGDVIYTDSTTGETAAQYHFSDHPPEGLPDRFHDIPSGTNAGIATEGDEVIFIRGPTGKEQDQLAQLTGIESEEFIAGFRSNIDRFVVRSIDTSAAYQVDLDSRQVESISNKTGNNNVTIMDDGPGWCQACLTAVGACTACASLCSTPGPICYGCVIGACGAGVRACTKCAQQCGCN